MIFDPDLLRRMMKTMDENGLDILTGVYYRRTGNYSPVLYKKIEFDEQDRCTWQELWDVPAPDSGLFEVEGCGFGCVMTRTTVIADVLASGEPLFTPLQGVGEDLSFCFRARKLGYKIFCDSTIKCGHVGQILINENFYEQFRGNK